ncbi:hypothetical protein [Congregibacter sp.]|uniref:hypothetical protein n=1 Tax=Congregibacter sp. TaxID=2744308 RepID=UPI003F6D459D
MGHKSTVKKVFVGLLLLLGSYTLFNIVAVAQPPAETPAPSTGGVDRETGDTDADPVTSPPVNQPFEDYEASEQISEDLSVAFPVDI